ncbi:MAG: response regulator transcription factor [Thermoleophilaceae bacterium]|nr:response regulator transcription factor [Thermoleophilaceae bacterium]
MAKRIMIVEDEHHIAELVGRYLTADGYETVWVNTGAQALDEFSRQAADLVILDIGLPDIDGFEVCRRLRARTSVPILMLTAREDEVDRVAGLESGADDYVVKPFSPRELVARVKAILRRTGSNGGGSFDEIVTLGPVTLNHAAHEVTVDGAAVELTAREFELLAALLSHPNVALSRDRLLELVWGGEYPGGTRTVDVHIAQLRRKLGDSEIIKTVHGLGYKASL